MKNGKCQEIENVKNNILYALAIDNIDLRIKYLEKCLNLCDDKHISKSQSLKLKRLINDCIIDVENKF